MDNSMGIFGCRPPTDSIKKIAFSTSLTAFNFLAKLYNQIPLTYRDCQFPSLIISLNKNETIWFILLKAGGTHASNVVFFLQNIIEHIENIDNFHILGICGGNGQFVNCGDIFQARSYTYFDDFNRQYDIIEACQTTNNLKYDNFLKGQAKIGQVCTVSSFWCEYGNNLNSILSMGKVFDFESYLLAYHLNKMGKKLLSTFIVSDLIDDAPIWNAPIGNRIISDNICKLVNFFWGQ